jgi:hypothetical protein
VTTANGPVRLLQHAICYAVESVDAVRPGADSLPTPCAEWDLRALLLHLNGMSPGTADGGSADRASMTQLAEMFRSHTRRLLRRCIGSGPPPDGRTAVVGAAEIAVHGWDVSVACGAARSIPDSLALGLQVLLPVVMDDALRWPLFGPPVPVSPLAGPSDRLVALLGRRP